MLKKKIKKKYDKAYSAISRTGRMRNGTRQWHSSLSTDIPGDLETPENHRGREPEARVVGDTCFARLLSFPRSLGTQHGIHDHVDGIPLPSLSCF